jgi:hypothetical protein
MSDQLKLKTMSKIIQFIVINQKPEYVGAPQKKFAWIIGLILAVLMFSF